MEGKYIHALALSDSHGNRSALEEILRRNADAEYIFHLGDNIDDARYIECRTRARVICVKGNCDMGESGNEAEEIVLMGQKIFLTHGHHYGVKYSYDRVFYAGQEREAKAVLFGHTHQQFCEFKDGLWLVNPGSAGASYDGVTGYATLLIGKMGVVPKLRRLEEW